MKQFTLDEALAALPDVARHAQRMVDARAALLATGGSSSGLERAVSTNGSGAARAQATDEVAQIDGLRAELMAEVDALEQLGVLVKDVDVGLVDFPARHPVSGEPVFLCWQVGEETIGYWHEPEAGFGGRKPLPFS